MPGVTKTNIKSKEEDQVWIRWFFISNWGPLSKCGRNEVESYIEVVVDYYSDDFAKKAIFEVIDGNNSHTVNAEDVIKKIA